MKPWHRDVMLYAGAAALIGFAFLVWPPLALLAFALECWGLMYLTAPEPPAQEDDDGG